MALLSLVYRHALWIAPLTLALGVFLLVQAISGVIRTGRQARLLGVPLVERQEVRFETAGPVVLEMEGPIFTRPFAGLEYRLVGPDGAEVRRRRALFRASSSGVTRGTVELRVFEIAVPGRHQLRVEGLEGARPRDAECLMIFARPHLGRSVAWVLGILLAAAVTIGSLVLFLLRLAKVGVG